MPLLDHFHPPVNEEIQWNTFHSAWATTLATQLSGVVPAQVPRVVKSVRSCTVLPDTTGWPVALGAVCEPAEPPAGIRSAASSAPTRIARAAMPFPLTRRCQ